MLNFCIALILTGNHKGDIISVIFTGNAGGHYHEISSPVRRISFTKGLSLYSSEVGNALGSSLPILALNLALNSGYRLFR